MDTLLERIWKGRWMHALLPLSFLFGSLLNFAFYYLGLAYKENVVRTYGFIVGQLLFAVLCGLAFLSAVKHERMRKCAWIGLSAVFFFYCANFAAGLLRHGMNSHWKDYFVHFVCFALPALLAGVFGALSRAEQKLLPLMEAISFFVLPGGVIYLNGLLFNCNPFGYNRDFGIVDYMGFAYTIMPFLLVHIIQFCDRAPLELPLLKRSAARPQLLRGAMIAIYWVGIIGSGTRGTYVCVAGFCVLLVISKLIHKDGALRAFVVSAVMAVVLLFNIFIYAPAGMYGVSRMGEFLNGLKQGELVTSSVEAEGTQDKLDDLVKLDGDQQVVNREEPEDQPSTPAEPAAPSSPDSSSEPKAPENVSEENLVIGNRGTLYKLAWKEFLKSPLTGMGLSGYPVKYGHYPHNVILELLCEGGVLLGAPILLFVLWAVIRMLILAQHDRSIRYLLLIFLTYAIRYNISGYVWACNILLCAVGYGLAARVSASVKRSTPSKEN